MKLLNKRVVFKEFVQKEPEGAIILVEKEKPIIVSGIVLAAAEDTNFKVGQQILVNNYHVDPIKWDKQDCFLTVEEHIIAYN